MALEGKLTEMPMLDLLRIFQRGGRSGKLVLANHVEWALVWLLEGQVVSALVLDKTNQHPLHSGEQAIFHLCAWPDGHFRYSPDPERGSYPVTIRRPTSALIFEVLQRRKGQPHVAPHIDLTLHTPLCALPQVAGFHEHVRLKVEEWSVLARIGQRSTPRELVAQTGLSAEQVLHIVSYLIEGGLIMPVPLVDLPQRRLTVEPPAGHAQTDAPVTNLTRAIRRRLHQIAVGA